MKKFKLMDFIVLYFHKMDIKRQVLDHSVV